MIPWKWTKPDRRKAQALNEAGLQLAQEQHDFSGAISQYRQAITADPRYATAHSNMGDCYAYLKLTDQALECYNRAIELDPDMVHALYHRGEIYAARQEYDKALADFLRVEALGGGRTLNIEMRLRKDIEAAQVFVAVETIHDEQFPGATRGITMVTQQTLAEIAELMMRGEEEAALDAANDLAERVPFSDELYLLRGLIFERMEHLPEAAADFTRVIKIAPQDPDGYTRRAAVYARINGLEAALKDYTRAIKLGPQSEMFARRGLIYIKLRQPDEALADFDMAMEMDPLNSDAYFYRGILFNQSQRLDDAILDFTHALELNPENHAVLPARALSYVAAGRLDDGIEDLENYIRRGGGGEMTLLQAKAMIALMQRQPPAA